MEEFEPNYHFGNLPPEDRCNAIKFNCCHPECDYRFSEGDRETPKCPECNTWRKVCGNHKRKGRPRCGFHGGATPMGIANVNYKGRGISKALPERMLEFYHLARQDPNIIEMNESILLLEARSQDLLNQVDEYASSKLWNDLGKLWQKWRNANLMAQQGTTRGAREKATNRAQELFIELEDLVMRGINNSQAWQEWYDVEERKRRMKNSEINRRKAAEAIITENQFKTMLGFIVNSIKTRVSDPDEQMNVLADMQQLNF